MSRYAALKEEPSPHSALGDSQVVSVALVSRSRAVYQYSQNVIASLLTTKETVLGTVVHSPKLHESRGPSLCCGLREGRLVREECAGSLGLPTPPSSS